MSKPEHKWTFPLKRLRGPVGPTGRRRTAFTCAVCLRCLLRAYRVCRGRIGYLPKNGSVMSTYAWHCVVT